MYTFTPMTEEEINEASVFESGKYDFQVLKAVRKISKSGNDMAEITISVWDSMGKQHNIFDYLVFSNIPLNIKKVKHFCDSTGLQEQYKEGKLPEDLSRLSGKVEIGVKEQTNDSNGNIYPKKNIVIDYIARENNSSVKDVKKDEFNDDIPF